MLSTFSSEFIMCRSCLLIERPSPAPSMLLLRDMSSLSKGTKSLSISSAFIPMPVSSAVIRSLTLLPSLFFSVHFISRVTFPFSVYFTALVRRFVTICFTLSSSPLRPLGIVLSMLKIRSSPLASARKRIRLYRSLISPAGE